MWPSASAIQGMNTALFDALEEKLFKLSDIKSAKIRLAPTVFNLHGKLAKYKAKFDALTQPPAESEQNVKAQP